MKGGKLPYVLVITKVTQLLVYTFIMDKGNPQFSTENCIILFCYLSMDVFSVPSFCRR